MLKQLMLNLLVPLCKYWSIIKKADLYIVRKVKKVKQAMISLQGMAYEGLFWNKYLSVFYTPLLSLFWKTVRERTIH